jgi:anti-sigma regulatory factor (Ser/Thr protein kinase)
MRSRLLRVAAVVLLVVAVLVAGLAVLTVVTAPLVIALELAAVAVVTGVATHRRRSRRRRATAPPPDPEPAGTDLEWATGWPHEPEPAAVPAVRERLTGVLSGWGLTGEAGEPTLLVVTELLDNVTAHGRGPTRLAVRLVADGVRVEVTDGSPEPPQVGPPDPAAPHGRGMVIVDGLARQWGWIDEPVGKTIWAVVPTGWIG